VIYKNHNRVYNSKKLSPK